MKAAWVTTGTSGSSLGWMLVSLMLVLMLMLTLVWLLKRLKVVDRWKSSMQIESALILGTQQRLLTVKVEGRRLLLGVTPNTITYLTELSTPVDSAVESVAPVPDFAERLKAMLRSHS